MRKRLIDNEPSWLFDCHRMSILKQRLRLQIDWRQKGRTFQFNLFLWVILHILYIPHNYVTPQAMPHAIPPFLLLPSPYQVTEKQFSTQFSWKDKANEHLRIIQSFIPEKKLNDCFFQSHRTAFWTEGPHIRLKVLVLWFFTLIAAMYLTIIMNWSSNKQIYRLYFNFYMKVQLSSHYNWKLCF